MTTVYHQFKCSVTGILFLVLVFSSAVPGSCFWTNTQWPPSYTSVSFRIARIAVLWGWGLSLRISSNLDYFLLIYYYIYWAHIYLVYTSQLSMFRGLICSCIKTNPISIQVAGKSLKSNKNMKLSVIWNVRPCYLAQNYTVFLYQVTRLQIAEDSNIHSCSPENLKSHII
jgi:hypothetical protein